MFSQTASITGIVLDEKNLPLENVNISSKTSGTTTKSDGTYLLQITADTKNTITFSHIGHNNIVLEDIILNTNETFEFNPVMKVGAIQIAGVEVSPTGKKSITGIITVSPELIRRIPGANAGAENLLKLLPGVSFSNELSTQYNVRGGNFDENLVYVNGIEVYRPFLVRSAQQEGFSFINSSMIENLEFSAGGFQSKYGDKLSSVLDITYKIPNSFALQAEASLLGGGLTLETASKNSNFSSITGIRYRNNALFINSQQTQTNVNPTFIDAQTYLTYRLSSKFRINFLGNLSVNDYQNEPLNRQTNFGTIAEPRALLVFYEGQEKNKYQTALGAIKADYFLNDITKLEFISSLYHTTEEEFSDIIATYELGSVDTNLGSENLGDIIDSRGIGAQQNRARNQLDALIFNLAHKGVIKKESKSLEWGIKFAHEDFRDQLRESEFIDSAGFFIRPPNANLINNQPEEPFEEDIIPFESVRATNFIKTNRVSAYTQFDNRTKIGNNNIYYNLGIRAQYWRLSGENIESNVQFLVSPRVQFGIKPDWEKDMLFRFAIGSYQQPPFYRELRDLNGNINAQVKAQKSIHLVLGNEYSFNLWNRPFKLVSEAYYKKLNDVNTYTIEDVRVRYSANNNAKAFAYGFDFRLNGAFVPGAESWVSLGYLRTEENIDNRGYISRPTDQRLKFGLLFQDYMPTIPNLKLYLNLVYNTGVPGGSPNNEDPYEFQNRLRDYRRADLGISYIFADRTNRHPKGHWLHKFKELNVGFEIFNLFNNQNSITNTWVRDVDTQQQFAIPNFLTSRILNIKLSSRF
ncbi:TonB-dependent receptor plug domain-containing protein [Croceitalea sp. P007]|uniref:TonB-dependent receptor plug domain-containing protein n=2 Tax=Croceitalea vernalis TaxID=3075599 RepID=A0ABU3BKR1_9FLAO|nr:TonB-dependent receptor plug domain-containing protein [Croceitalea sp. P007]MDT0622756.1 TonB-dependent receptor plug domain-containing protein [Croceitalea sp. P007]